MYLYLMEALKKQYKLIGCSHILMNGQKYNQIVKKKTEKVLGQNNIGLTFYLVFKCKLNKITVDG